MIGVMAAGPERNVVLAITYGVVVFLILVKGTTLGWLARTSTAARNASSREEAAFGVRRL